MQLRVARLCLDCEELFVGDSCPVCASQHYAFLSQWLPVEERRKWRRAPVGAPEPARGVQRLLRAGRRLIARLFDEEPPRSASGSPRTRASDAVPTMAFEDLRDDPPPRPARAADPVKSNAR